MQLQEKFGPILECPNESKSQWQSLSQVTTIYSTEKVTFIDLFEMVQDTKDFCMLLITFEIRQ